MFCAITRSLKGVVVIGKFYDGGFIFGAGGGRLSWYSDSTKHVLYYCTYILFKISKIN